jgi:voltage-gated potassium channel
MATPIFRWRHLTLLILLLVIMIITPILGPLRHGLLVMTAIGAAILLTASYAISDRKLFFIIGIILSIVSLIGTWFLVTYPGHLVVIVAHSCVIVLLSFFAVTILSYVVAEGRVTVDRIFAAICAYLLIGYAWAFGYAVFDELYPNSFTVATEIARNDYIGRVVQMRYFSFITLATVGYGDIVPRSPGAQTLVILEAIVGQFYLVALIGRLVGLHIVHGTNQTGAVRN